MIKLNYYVQSKNWSRRMSKVTKITKEVVKKKTDFNFDKNINYYLNIILLNNKKMKKLNLKFKKINKTTDVLTFVSTLKNINYNKTKYCDIFFSAETIKLYSKLNKISFYDHFTHLLVHSFMHINVYMNKKAKDFI